MRIAKDLGITCKERTTRSWHNHQIAEDLGVSFHDLSKDIFCVCELKFPYHRDVQKALQVMGCLDSLACWITGEFLSINQEINGL